MRAAAVAQLTAWSLPIPKNMGWNPVIGNFYLTFICCEFFKEKTKIKKKSPRMAHLKRRDVSRAKTTKLFRPKFPFEQITIFQRLD